MLYSSREHKLKREKREIKPGNRLIHSSIKKRVIKRKLLKILIGKQKHLFFSVNIVRKKTQ